MNLRTVTIVVVALALGACGWSYNPEKHAEWFFDKGENSIIKSLKKQDVGDTKLDQARAIIERHRAPVTHDLTAYFGDQRDVLSGVVSGKDTQALLGLEQNLHNEHVRVLKSIGKMHEELAQTVGTQVWAAASDYRKQKFDDRVKD